jgi:hypothetical protein
MSERRRHKNPLDLHIHRLCRLHDLDIGNFCSGRVNKLSDDQKKQIIEKLNKHLGIDPIITNHIDVVC